jgi:hypothetical protein
MSSHEKKSNIQDVAAVITAMTDDEQPFLLQTLEAVFTDDSIGQIVLCIEEKNTWLNKILINFVDDTRLLIVRIPMAFLGEIRNRALEEVKMPWVAYCDGDDVWCAGKTYAQRSWAEITGSDFVGADHYLVNEDGKVCAFAFAQNIPMPSSWLVRTSVMKQYPFDDSLATAEDGDWWVRTNGLIHKTRCPKMLLKYRVRYGSLSSNAPSKRRKASIVAFASFPILRELILFCTWCIWSISKREEYVWLKIWD